MNFKKVSKVGIILLISLFATTTLFAAGIKEVSNNSTLAIIENIENNGNDFNFQVLTETDEIYVNFNSADTTSILDLASYQIGDYIEIGNLKDSNGTLTSDSVRYVTPLVLSGAVSFHPVTPQIEVPENDYGFDNNLDQSVNYAYGSLIVSSFQSQGLFLNAGYFVRGVLEAVKLEDQSMFNVEQLNNFLQQYQAAVQADNTILPKDFGSEYTLEEIEKLPVASELADQFAYSYGFMFAANFLTTGFPLDASIFSQGFLDAAFENEMAISNYQMQNSIRDFEEKFTADQEAKLNAAKEKNLKEANDFLAVNKDAKDVITTDSGLQYKVLTEGDGAIPASDATVVLNYELTLPNGQVVDSSYERGETATIPLTNVIEGFREAVSNMKTGSTIIAWIPPQIGYGEDGNNAIEPNMLLTFKIELISIEAPTVTQ